MSSKISSLLERTKPWKPKSKQDQVNNVNSAFIFKISLFMTVDQGGPGGQSKPGGPGGPGCQCGHGDLCCPGGPGDQVCQCIWFTWSKQSDYRENLRCHACD